MVDDKVIKRWHALAPRDRLALSVLLFFLLLFTLGYGGYHVHVMAQKAKLEYEQNVEEYFWLRNQSGRLIADNAQATDSPQADVEQLLSQYGIEDVQVIASANSVQLSFAESSQMTLSQVLEQLQQRGWSFERLSIEQEPKTRQLQVQATMVR